MMNVIEVNVTQDFDFQAAHCQLNPALTSW